MTRTRGTIGRVEVVAIAMLGLLTLAPNESAAQYTRTDPPLHAFRLGPLRLTPLIALQNAGRDSNVYFDPTDPQEDQSVVLRGGVEGFMPVGRRLRLSGRGWVDWSYFQVQSSETSFDPGGDGRAEIDFGPFTFVAGGGGFQAHQSTAIDIDDRLWRSEVFGFGGLEWRLASRISLSGGIEYRSYRYDPNARYEGSLLSVAANLNRDSTTIRGSFRYKLTPLTTFVALTDVVEDDFILAQPELRITKSYRYLGGFEFGQRAVWSGRLLAGIRDFPESTAASVPAYRGPAFQINLTWPALHRVRLLGSLNRDVFVSASAASSAEDRGRNSYTLLAARGTAEIALPLRLVGRLTGGYDKSDYLRPTTIDGVELERSDQLYTVTLTLLRRLSDNLGLGLTASHYWRRSTLPDANFERWVYGISAEFTPERRR